MPSAMPRNSDIDPSVTISGGMSSRAISVALSAPPARPGPRGAADADVPVLHGGAEHDGGQPQHRTDGQIDPAADQNRRQRNGEQSELDARPQDFEPVGDRQELRREAAERDDLEQHRDRENDSGTPRHAAPP